MITYPIEFKRPIQTCRYIDNIMDLVDRVLSPDIVQFRSACLRTEIFLRELTLSSTQSSNPKSSHSVDP